MGKLGLFFVIALFITRAHAGSIEGSCTAEIQCQNGRVSCNIMTSARCGQVPNSAVKYCEDLDRDEKRFLCCDQNGDGVVVKDLNVAKTTCKQ